jgi:hypothetical protein
MHDNLHGQHTSEGMVNTLQKKQAATLHGEHTVEIQKEKNTFFSKFNMMAINYGKLIKSNQAGLN